MNRRPALLVACGAAAVLFAMPTVAAPALRCAVEAPARVAAGQAVVLRFTLTNPGPAPLQVLRWDTPFEGSWLAPFIELKRDGRPVAYQGAMARRAEPKAESYLRLEAHGSASAEIELGPAFDVSVPGRYRVQPRLHIVDLHVAHAGPVERPRAEHQGADVACPAVQFQVLIPR
jgi:hypothetical protein